MSDAAPPPRSRREGDDAERRILAAALDVVAAAGPAGASPAAVAAAAGVPEGEVAQRWPSPAALATAAVASLDTGHRAAATGPFDELVAELVAFRRTMSHPAARAVGGAACDDATWPELARRYRREVVRPQRSRLRRILDQARRQDLLDADDAAITTAVSCCTGSWYGLLLADVPPPRDWASTLARLTWRSLGGQPPG